MYIYFFEFIHILRNSILFIVGFYYNWIYTYNHMVFSLGCMMFLAWSYTVFPLGSYTVFIVGRCMMFSIRELYGVYRRELYGVHAKLYTVYNRLYSITY